MNPEVKALWVKALRSRKYKQGSQFLVRQDGDVRKHCCLGVLCEIAPEGMTSLVPDTSLTAVLGFTTDPHDVRTRALSFLPTQVAAWAEVGRDTQSHLASLNDSGNWGFRKIATYIEENL